MKSILCISISLIFLISCNSNHKVLMNPNYKNKDLSDKKMMLMPIADSILIVQDKEDVIHGFKDDNRDPEIIIRESAYETINNRTKKSLKGVTFLIKDVNNNEFNSFSDSSVYFSISKKIVDDTTSIKFHIPKHEILNKENLDVDIVIVINKMIFGEKFNHHGTYYTPGNTIKTPGGSFTTPGTFTSSSTLSLNAYFEFIIYDYSENEIIAYGTDIVSTAYWPSTTKEVWISTFKSVASAIFKETPFKWKTFFVTD